MINNPIIKNQGTCDAHFCVANGYVYMSVGIDVQTNEKDYWSIESWRLYRTKNLVDWEKVCDIFPESFYLGKTIYCWASDLVYKNGEFYFYFSYHDKHIGVLKSKNPFDGFEDVLKKPLIEEGAVPTKAYDPTVFTDEHASYIVFGCRYEGDYHIARLNDDMVSLAEKPRKIEVLGLPIKDDKNYLHKKGDTYYLSTGGYFCTSKSVYGPYTFAGNVRTSRDHTSFFTFKNQDFTGFTLLDPTCFNRAVGLTYVQYLDNGAMYSDGLINEFGVGYYDAKWNVIEAEWFLRGKNVVKKQNEWGSIDVIVNGDSVLCYPNVENMEQFNAISFYCVSVGGMTVYVRENDEYGKVLATVNVVAAGGESIGCYYKRNTAVFAQPTSKNLCLTFEGKGRVDLFTFYNTVIDG